MGNASRKLGSNLVFWSHGTISNFLKTAVILIVAVQLLVAGGAQALDCDPCREKCDRVANVVYDNLPGVPDDIREQAAELAYLACMREFCESSPY